jgi:hypothetical protein
MKFQNKIIDMKFENKYLIRKNKPWLLVRSFLLLLLLIFLGYKLILFFQVKKEDSIPFSIQNHTVIFPKDSEFLTILSSEPAILDENGSQELVAVGQIVLLIEPSGALIGSKLNLVHLDINLSKNVQLDKIKDSIGVAFGLVEIDSDLIQKIKKGITLKISLYGLRKDTTTAIVVNTIINKKNPNRTTVVFRIAKGADWYPGANCEVTFSNVQDKLVRIPSRAIVHHGKKDFVFVFKEKNILELKPIHLIKEEANYCKVSGLIEKDSVVTRGAILLKPILVEMIDEK